MVMCLTADKFSFHKQHTQTPDVLAPPLGGPDASSPKLVILVFFPEKMVIFVFNLKMLIILEKKSYFHTNIFHQNIQPSKSKE